MRGRLLLFIAYMVTAATSGASEHPRWSLHVISGRGESYIEEPSCHTREYYLSDPLHLDYGSDLYGKTPDEIKDQIKTQRIGVAEGYVVDQVSHDINDGELIMKMILVQRKRGELCEIYHQQSPRELVEAGLAFWAKTGRETILATTDLVSGNGNWRAEAYWAFDKDGPIELDVTGRVQEIQKKLLPEGSAVMNGSGFNIQTLRYATPVWKQGDAHCCPSGGKIEIKFDLRDHHLIVVTQRFEPN